MTNTCRAWWRNCAMESDPEILAIDRMEDAIAPVAEDVSKIRELISTLELCHHKAPRWVDNIMEAIGTGQTSKGLGARSPGQPHPVERVWENACAALSGWVAGSPAGAACWSALHCAASIPTSAAPGSLSRPSVWRWPPPLGSAS